MKGFFEMTTLVPALLILLVLFSSIEILGKIHNRKVNLKLLG